MKNMGMTSIVIGLLGVAVILLIDVVMGRPYQIGTKSIVGLAACAVILVFGIRNLRQRTQA